jgi:tRNA threonylcarbamoyladenosine biosynthesis protein TsaE
MQGTEVATASPEETEALGAALGRAAQGGELLGLVGELGAGKTCLVRGLAAGLGIDPARVHSPSFTIVTEYRGGRLPLTHVDLYRLERPHDDELFLRDAFYGEGVAAVEWFDRLLPAAGDELLIVTLRFTASEGRAIHLEARGARHRELLESARAALAPSPHVPR